MTLNVYTTTTDKFVKLYKHQIKIWKNKEYKMITLK